MGREITAGRFTRDDFAEFSRRLREETELFRRLNDDGLVSQRGFAGGFELEAWLVDGRGMASPSNAEFLDALRSPLVVPELALFNVEINGTPQHLRGAALRRLEEELRQTWSACQEAANPRGLRLMMIGTLPTLRAEDLTLDKMSQLARFRALNQQILFLRGGEALRLDIAGRELLKASHGDVMLEAGATSLQVHLQVPADRAARYYNEALQASAPTVAACANSPFLFGRDLWAETRIPLFEQAVDVGTPAYKRVGFGHAYLRSSLTECFEENVERYPVLLPEVSDAVPGRLEHLRMHNGTIWRWNRPLVGFDADGRAHVRIEHRPLPAGPSVGDCIANAAFFFGLVHEGAAQGEGRAARLDFATARRNFYAAARYGLDAVLEWEGGRRIEARALILDHLLARAERGLRRLEIDRGDAAHYLAVIRARTDSGQNGATWQRRWMERHGRDLCGLAMAYAKNQDHGKPIHEWRL